MAPHEVLIREAEELFQTSLQIERNCLEKIKSIERRSQRCESRQSGK